MSDTPETPMAEYERMIRRTHYSQLVASLSRAVLFGRYERQSPVVNFGYDYGLALQSSPKFYYWVDFFK